MASPIPITTSEEKRVREGRSSNLAYVEFHTGAMGLYGQIFEYAVESTGSDDRLIASSCALPDALMPYRCNLDPGEDGTNTQNISRIRSSGGNTAAIEIGAYG